ncbi:hypothetical protein Kpol_1023p82 [Vanderwaltozyma polyspora DSM 70294]|uniref:U3 small nucleolar RNA-associated protein 6 N-terminal domain-containing protein n=1 Tax=Vanderwaltozyma polyspora (strain ATCC 22028 / DSM 70294 / BCRC 21397 / CBS 2163 / NBRC 10782 / NRRL Y-8283 / UCD 57-17) TaxID=436907 RepID=A7TFV3_VANPO|nr:uncharacterized protein Kpol_1023p82 [Vanderwaltozyma polyspora DSM 70294]EDO18911.1 hypothetical protein Kpol_1023p82 [Vanderwaltozyma polyspora DSM 70294]
MSSKSRYYLEQCIPELDDLVEKKLFTKNEVSAIMKKRTNFEHRLNSRGSSVNDYLKYVTYESNVDNLRLKRVKRILQANKSNSISDWSMQKRIMFIYQRGCNKFPKDLKFWAMYLHYLKSRGNQTSYKKIHNVYNELIKLHPSNIDVWISCAKYEYEVHANFKSCRTVFQNGLRFNADQPKLWYEYVKFELNFITKLINRRKVMGLINEREQELDMLKEQEEKNADDENDAESDGDEEASGYLKRGPSTGDSMKDKLNELPEADMNMLGDKDTNPALHGDIALTIFDIAIETLGKYYINKHMGYYAVSDMKLDKELRKDTVKYLFEKSLEYVALFEKFDDLDRVYLINHIIQFWKNDMHDMSLPNELPELYVKNLIMDITLNIRFIDVESLDIDQLQLSVKKYFAYKNKLKDTVLTEIQSSYTSYLRENYLCHLDKDDSRYGILDQIIKKL